MLDEAALRKPEFMDGVKIKLGDGQEWMFRRPRIRLAPKRGEDGSLTAGLKVAPGQAEVLEKCFEAMWNLSNETVVDTWSLRFGAASALLLANYSLTDDDIAELIYWDSEEPECFDRWELIDDLLRGVAPKVISAISELPAE